MTEPQYLFAINLTDQSESQLLQMYRQHRLTSMIVCITGLCMLLFSVCVFGGFLVRWNILADMMQDPLIKLTMGVGSSFVGIIDFGLAYFLFMPRANAAKAEMERRGLTVVS